MLSHPRLHIYTEASSSRFGGFVSFPFFICVFVCLFQTISLGQAVTSRRGPWTSGFLSCPFTEMAGVYHHAWLLSAFFNTKPAGVGAYLRYQPPPAVCVLGTGSCWGASNTELERESPSRIIHVVTTLSRCSGCTEVAKLGTLCCQKKKKSPLFFLYGKGVLNM